MAERFAAVDHDSRGFGEALSRIADRIFLIAGDWDWSCFEEHTDRIKQAMTGAAVQQILELVHESAANGGFDRSDAHLSRTDVTLDERGWKELAAELDAILKRIDRIEAASSERLKKANHDGQTRGTVVLALLERLMAPDAPPKNLGKPAPKRSRTRATS